MDKEFRMLVSHQEWMGYACGVIKEMFINYKNWHFDMENLSEDDKCCIIFEDCETGEMAKRQITIWEKPAKKCFADFILLSLGHPQFGSIEEHPSTHYKNLDVNLKLCTYVFKDRYRLITLCSDDGNTVLLSGDESFCVSEELSWRIKSYQTRNYNLRYADWYNRKLHRKRGVVSVTQAKRMIEENR